MSTVAGQNQGAPVAGWYADPQGAGDRWWDGHAWTDHVQPTPPAAAIAPVLPHPTPVAAGGGFVPLSGSGRQYGAGGQPGAADQPGAVNPYGAVNQPGSYGFPGQNGFSGQNGFPGRGGAPSAPALGVDVRNRPATIGMVLGIIAVAAGIITGFWIGSALCVLVSARGLRRSRELAKEGYGPIGRGRAIAGLVLSILSFLVVLALRLSSV